MPLELVFVHAPKTGSTSLNPAMRAKFGAALREDWGDRPLDPQGPRWTDTAALLVRNEGPALGGARAVTGHFWAAKYETVPAERRATILRDPVSRLISHYYFWQTRPPSGHSLHERFLRERPSIASFARSFPMAAVYSQAFFGGCDMDSFTYVGDYRDLSRDWSGVMDRLGLSHGPVHANRTDPAGQLFGPPRAEVEADAALIAELRSILRDDIAFYERWVMPL